MSHNSNNLEFNRRDFLRSGSLAAFMAAMGAVELRAAEKKSEGKKDDDKKAGPPVKCAVIGCGVWGREMLKCLSRLPNAPVVAICDNYEKSMSRAGQSAPQAEKMKDYQQLLEKKDVQAVLIATPTYLHREIAVAAIQAGKHVYCEAPLAGTMEDATAIAKAAKAASKQMFQPGLILRTNPIHNHVLGFVRTGAMGKVAFTRAQNHKKETWRRTSPTPEREKEINWHLNRETSLGLVGEKGVHNLDSAAWYLKALPIAVSGNGAILAWNDGRDVFDTILVTVEYPNNIRMSYSATLTNSFEGSFEVFGGSDAAINMRDSRAWLIKETDAPLLGWEVYARKEDFFPSKDSGIALVANSTKLLAQGKEPAEAAADSETPLFYAMEAFIDSIHENKANEANWEAGFTSAVMAIKASEAINKGQRIEFTKEMFTLG